MSTNSTIPLCGSPGMVGEPNFLWSILFFVVHPTIRSGCVHECIMTIWLPPLSDRSSQRDSPHRIPFWIFPDTINACIELMTVLMFQPVISTSWLYDSCTRPSQKVFFQCRKHCQFIRFYCHMLIIRVGVGYVNKKVSTK